MMKRNSNLHLIIRLICVTLICLPLCACSLIQETLKDKEGGNVCTSIAECISAGDYEALAELYSAEARGRLPSPEEIQHYAGRIWGRELTVVKGRGHESGGYTTYGEKYHNSINWAYLLKSQDGRYYSMTYSYCNRCYDPNRVGLESVTIVNSDEDWNLGDIKDSNVNGYLQYMYDLDDSSFHFVDAALLVK